MLRSPYSSPATSSSHVRHLLDQRMAHRIDPDDRFSQFSDTPSVYSPAHFTRTPLDAEYDYGTSARHPFTNPNVSTLDFDDDPRFSITDSQNDEDDDAHSFEEQHDDRLSYLGPKMRFHSRAPWEMDDGISEEPSPPSSPKHHHAFPFSLGRAAHSTSPHPSQTATTRPSTDSSRSHIIPKRSFDTISSQLSSKGALYALAQESLSTASLTKSTPTQKDGLIGKLSSFGRGRPTSPRTSPIGSPHRSPLSTRIPLLPRNQLDKRTKSFEYGSPPSNLPRVTMHTASTSSQEESVHPYANPDLIPAVDEFETNASYSSDYHPPLPSRNDSTVTVTQVFTRESTSYAASRTSISSLVPNPTGRKRMPSVQERGISSPVAVQGTSLPPEIASQEGQPPGIAQLPGWTEKFVPPAFNLISLEEARAQRARNSTATTEESSFSVASLGSQSSANFNNDEQAALNSSTGSRARGRTISAGAKAKSAFHSMVGSVMPAERRDSEPAFFASSQGNGVSQHSRPLKHKKSGFRRMFTGGKDKEADGPSPVPANPLEMNPPRKSTTRVPVPSLSQLPFEMTSSQETFSTASDPELAESAGSKRTPPALHINTISQPAMAGRNNQPRTTTNLFASNAPTFWNEETYPRSAPADVTTFPALRLRPVSGLFSSHFENIVPELQTASSRSGVSSPTGLISPITPNERFSRPDVESEVPDIKPLPSATSELASSLRRVTELEEQVRNLTVELHSLRERQQQDGVYCNTCGRGRASPTHDVPPSSASSSSSGSSVVNRPRAKIGTGTARFVNGLA